MYGTPELAFLHHCSERENTSNGFRESSHVQLTFPSYQGVTTDVTYQRTRQTDVADTEQQDAPEPCKAFGVSFPSNSDNQ